MLKPQNIWLEVGYAEFALQGYRQIRIERLAKKVGISKSSFYHHFADLEVFVECLLDYHLEQARILAQKEENAQSIQPELVEILLAHKVDLLFNRELRIHRDNKTFAKVLAKSDAIVGDAFVKLWLREAKLNLKPSQIEAIYDLALENFFLQISEDNLNREWLYDYFDNLERIAANFTP